MSNTELSDNSHPLRRTLPVVFGLWVLAVAFAFWWFDAQYLRALDQQAVFEGAKFEKAQPATEGKPVVLMFNEGDCRCIDPVEDHVSQLTDQFSGRASFLEAKQAQQLGSELAEAAATVKVAPAVAIWDELGELAYFGPYSSGSVCGEGVDFVAYTLEELEQGQNPKWINQAAVGCFCT